MSLRGMFWLWRRITTHCQMVHASSIGGRIRLTSSFGISIILHPITTNPTAISGAYMRNALFIWSPFTRSSSDISTTASSHEYSTSSPDAIIRKFWLELLITKPCSIAKVMVVVAIIMHARFLRNSSVLNLFGSTNLKNSRFSIMATIT